MTLRRLLPVLAAASLALATRPAAGQRGCTVPRGEALAIGAGPMEMVPGQTQQLAVGTSVGPYAPPQPLPRSCRIRWSVSRGAPGTVDGRGRLTVSRRATPGVHFIVFAVMGRDTAGQRVTVVDPRPNPLAGTWGQAQPATCTPAAEQELEPVRELDFKRDGTFAVTFIPFETYHDYWGRYTYDASTGALTLHVEHGNRIPDGLDLSGTARVVNGRLTLDGMWLGQPNGSPPRSCRYTFAH